MKTFTVYNHQNKAKLITDVLLKHGWKQARLGFPADLLLIDTDVDTWKHRDMIEHYHAEDAKVVIYPHGAGPIMFWDGLSEPHPAVDCVLASSPGAEQVLKLSGYPKPIHMMGWPFSFVGLFLKPTSTENMRVLFAPMHPDSDGNIRPHHKEMNARIFEKLLAADYQLTVRFIGDLGNNGLWIEPNVTYVAGQMDNSTTEIEHTDCVVASGTFAYMAVAMGRPTVMFCSAEALGLTADDGRKPAHFDQYEALVKYPIDYANGDLKALINFACKGDESIKTWRDLWIDLPLNEDKLLDALEG